MVTKKLSEISTRISSGLTPLRTNPKFWENACIPWLKTEQLGKKYIYDTNEYISSAAVKETSIKVFPENTLSIAMYGEGKTRGNLSIIKKPMATNQACCNVEIDECKADYEYVYYFLKTQYEELRNLSSGIRNNLNSNDIKNFPIRLPETKEEQTRIASVLKSLDAKIELNNRINAELEAMAKTLYDYWFVQFDFPFDFAKGKSDANGKPYKSSGGKMVYNPTLKLEIPEGWEVMRLLNCLTLTRGVTYEKEDVYSKNNPGVIGVLRATNISRNIIDLDDLVYLNQKNISEVQYIKRFDTLIVMSSGSMDHIGKNGIYYFDDPNAFGAFCSKLTIMKDFLFYVSTFLNTEWFKFYIKNQCLGTNINNLTNDHIKDCPLVKPDENVLVLFEKIVSSFHKRIAMNFIESRQLKELRDWLLPMLMNGQVTVEQ